MHFPIASAEKVFNRGAAPVAFLIELVTWAKSADDSIFAYNENADIYGKVRGVLGPYNNLHHRKAVMLEVLRVLAGFESSWDWKEGVDTSKLGIYTPHNAEAGAWQVSFDARQFAPELRHLCITHGATDAVTFQRVTKFNHPFAMEFVARLLRYTTKHNGPLYMGEERAAIRRSLRGVEHSIYPWLRRGAVHEFEAALCCP